jgi:stearoyl-CoA desaturase (Delta-9 desaturase)
MYVGRGMRQRCTPNCGAGPGVSERHEQPMSTNRLERIFVLGLVIAPLFGTLVAIWLLWQRLVHWNDIAILVAMYFFTALGITIGYHRMLTHRSFDTHPAVRFLFLMLGSMAMEGPALDWASIHIKHHANTDEADDPHSPVDGFFHAHMGWFLSVYHSEPETYGKWLLKDRMVMFMSKTFFLWAALGFVIPYLIGGWTAVLWGGLVRIFLTHHVTWSVNSVCHIFGRRMFDTNDQSKNQWLVGLLAFGEGWHNNHHAFPRSAFHGLRWWQFDLSAYVIRLLELTGLAWNVWRIPAESLKARLSRGAKSEIPITQ